MPLALAALADAHLLDERIVTALGLTVPGGTTMPLGQLLGALAVALPVGDLEARVGLLGAIPAAVATYCVVRSALAAPFAGPRLQAGLVTLALGAVVGLFLFGAPMETALVVLACELAIDADLDTRGAAVFATVLAAWGAPRHAGTLAVAWWLAGVSVPLGAWIAGLVGCALLAAISLGHDGIGGAPWSPFAGHPFVTPDGAHARAAGLVVVLAAVTWLGTRASPGSRIRVGLALAAALGIAIRAPGALSIAVALLVPLAAQAGSALTMAASEVARAEAQRLRRVAAYGLVPALCLGLAARGVEVELAGTRLGPSERVSRPLHALFGMGGAPPRAIWMVEDEAGLVRALYARTVLGLRPDVRLLPVQGLLTTLAIRTANATMSDEPATREIVRALLARGNLEPSDMASLAQRVPLVADVAYGRLRGVSRHAQPLGTAVAFFLERVDPSDRRLRRAQLERRWAAVRLSPIDPLRDHLRRAALREARLLSAALDKDGALAALRRAEAFGHPTTRVRALIARASSKHGLEGFED